MYKNILIPVILDGSRNSELAISAARATAAPDAMFTLLHVIEPMPVYAADYMPAETFTINREVVERDLAKMAAGLPNGNPQIADGRPGPRIVRWATENGCDLVVLASHRPAFSDILLGSVAAYVVRHAPCAVHVVR